MGEGELCDREGVVREDGRLTPTDRVPYTDPSMLWFTSLKKERKTYTFDNTFVQHTS